MTYSVPINVIGSAQKNFETENFEEYNMFLTCLFTARELLNDKTLDSTHYNLSLPVLLYEISDKMTPSELKKKSLDFCKSLEEIFFESLHKELRKALLSLEDFERNFNISRNKIREHLQVKNS